MSYSHETPNDLASFLYPTVLPNAPNDAQWHIDTACSEFWPLPTGDAFNVYVATHRVPDLFYRDDAGKRSVWRRHLEYAKVKRITSGLPEVAYEEFKSHPGSGILAMVDRPKVKQIAKLVAHPSEPGWNLPADHPRHISNFPPEILDTILNSVLAANPNERLRPLMKQDPESLSDYLTTSEPHLTPRFSGLRRGPYLSIREFEDAAGTYTEYRHVYRKPVDATILRVSKNFNHLASGMLYGNNVLTFEMKLKDGGSNEGHSITSDDEETEHCPSPNKPDPLRASFENEILHGLEAISRNRPIEELPGWIYHDPFLLFLYTIGINNCAMIRTLRFAGTVVVHDCGDEHEDCSDDLVHSLRVYLPFFREFCTGLETLIIRVFNDTSFDPTTETRGPLVPETTEGGLKPFLEQEVLKIRTLRKLEITEYPTNETPDFAKVAIAKIADRAKTRMNARAKWADHLKQLKSEREKKLQVEIEVTKDMKSSYGFCGEDHIAEECWNLCNFCGEFGHFRKGCLRAED